MVTKTTRVLIVDDHPFIREGIRFYLRESDEFEVVGEAADGAEAVRMGIELHPDIVIMDWKLPDFDGLEATKRLRQAVPSIRVLVLSIQRSQRFIDQAVEAGAAGWISKDSSPYQLINTLTHLRDQAAPVGTAA